MQRKYWCVRLHIILMVTSTVFVDGFPQAAEQLLEVQNYVTKRFRRGAVDFHKAIRCYQPTTNVLGSYGSYGCFCGFSGKGQPLDETDKCCQIHDKCYAAANVIEKTFWDCVASVAGHLLVSYNYNCVNGEITCDSKDTPYRRKLCECDRAAAECFYEASSTYHPQLLHVDFNKYCSENASSDDLNLTDYENRYVPKSFAVEQTTVPPKNKKVDQKEEIVVPHLLVPNKKIERNPSKFEETKYSNESGGDKRSHRHVKTTHHNKNNAGKYNKSHSTEEAKQSIHSTENNESKYNETQKPYSTYKNNSVLTPSNGKPNLSIVTSGGISSKLTETTTSPSRLNSQSNATKKQNNRSSKKQRKPKRYETATHKNNNKKDNQHRDVPDELSQSKHNKPNVNKSTVADVLFEKMKSTTESSSFYSQDTTQKSHVDSTQLKMTQQTKANDIVDYDSQNGHKKQTTKSSPQNETRILKHSNRSDQVDQTLTSLSNSKNFVDVPLNLSNPHINDTGEKVSDRNCTNGVNCTKSLSLFVQNPITRETPGGGSSPCCRLSFINLFLMTCVATFFSLF